MISFMTAPASQQPAARSMSYSATPVQQPHGIVTYLNLIHMYVHVFTDSTWQD